MRSAEWWRRQTGRLGRAAGKGRRLFTAWQRPHTERTNTTRNGLAAAYSRSLTDAGRPALRAGGRSASRPLPHAPSSIAHIASGTASAPVPTGVAVGDADRSLSSTHAPAAPVGVSVGVGVCGPIPHCTGAAVAPPSAAAALSAAALSGLPHAQQLASAASRERGRREQQWPSAMAVGNGRRKRPSATAVGNRARQRGRPG